MYTELNSFADDEKYSQLQSESLISVYIDKQTDPYLAQQRFQAATHVLGGDTHTGPGITANHTLLAVNCWVIGEKHDIEDLPERGYAGNDDEYGNNGNPDHPQCRSRGICKHVGLSCSRAVAMGGQKRAVSLQNVVGELDGTGF
ncbi:hypothetical protein DOTSEDRAFT_37518 [Dothistroma septosporum NZE10]|uniref:Uncharacterized protein n=1 Tax=Dothistroma septosporum (strain NZE10 / CBS 128990) TaxID=675120 RepID=N1PDT4_DOTSN|nr:hypothetical protein DOTSEDRAFT_37518 [Dothistroma septosporum NZE10]